MNIAAQLVLCEGESKNRTTTTNCSNMDFKLFQNCAATYSEDEFKWFLLKFAQLEPLCTFYERQNKTIYEKFSAEIDAMADSFSTLGDGFDFILKEIENYLVDSTFTRIIVSQFVPMACCHELFVKFQFYPYVILAVISAKFYGIFPIIIFAMLAFIETIIAGFFKTWWHYILEFVGLTQHNVTIYFRWTVIGMTSYFWGAILSATAASFLWKIVTNFRSKFRANNHQPVVYNIAANPPQIPAEPAADQTDVAPGRRRNPVRKRKQSKGRK